MFGSLVTTEHVSFVLVFFEGLLSFFSPCVIPLIPIYMGYLAGNAKRVSEDGIISYERKKVFFHTVFFVLGISISFFILGMSFSALGRFFQAKQILFTRIGGILIIILGLFQLGIFDFKWLQRERKIRLNLGEKKVNPLIAFVMGFTFSFAWTPCVGPALSSVLILASSAKNSFAGNMLVFVYALGFIIPFLLLGLFTTQVLNFLKNKQKLLKYTIKIGGVILILIGIMTFTGWMNGISGYLNKFSAVEETTAAEEITTVEETTVVKKTTEVEETTVQVEEETTKREVLPAFDFTLTDQYGNTHTLSDYKGKVVFLNFWATWCPPCKEEMPDIEELYQEYGENQEDVIFLGVANPKSEEYPNNQDIEKEDIDIFLEENGYTFPVVYDETGDVFYDYFITAFPTTFMIDTDGNIYGYVPGMLTKDIMINIINDTIDSTNGGN
ncbi:MAG: redoxin domain-containing protein [Clostridiales bacterium]|nr:redoxin domain-containing protein [Clostridiales bacterium]